LKEELLNEIKVLFVFKDPENRSNVLIVKNDDKVFAFGSNYCGLLGFGNNKSITQLKLNEDLSSKQIIDFKNSYRHVIARTINGKIYCWGFNEYGVLGNGREGFSFSWRYYRPELNEYLCDKNIIDICCGFGHSLVLTNSGEVYAWGLNEYGQVGNRSYSKQLIPQKVNGFNDEKVVMISCGSHHSMALTESGHVFSWGLNACGQLGLDSNENTFKPSIVILRNYVLIKRISCAQSYSLLLSRDGNIHWYGFNGIESTYTTSQSHKKLSFNTNEIIEIASHYNYSISIALTVNGIYYVWGECGEKEEIREPIETEFKSFDEIFAQYFGITYKTLNFSENEFRNKKSVLLNFKEEIQEKYSTGNRLLKNISKSFNDPKYSDLKFKIENKHIYVHKYILKINSKYFESKLTESSRAIREITEGRKIENEIEIKEYSYDVYYAFLKYLYTDCIDIEDEKAMDLLILTEDYKEEDLKQKCLEVIKNSITIENVCSFYCFSIRENINDLKDFCFEIAFNNLKEVKKTKAFQQMDESSAKIFKSEVFDKQ
jgi:RCC1 and BTB domain-containing protein